MEPPELVAASIAGPLVDFGAGRGGLSGDVEALTAVYRVHGVVSIAGAREKPSLVVATVPLPLVHLGAVGR